MSAFHLLCTVAIAKYIATTHARVGYHLSYKLTNAVAFNALQCLTTSCNSTQTCYVYNFTVATCLYSKATS